MGWESEALVTGSRNVKGGEGEEWVEGKRTWMRRREGCAGEYKCEKERRGRV